MNAKNAKPKKEAQARRPSRKAKVKATLGEFDLRDYRNVEVLRRFLSETGKILPRRRTGLSAKEQRILAKTIKRARILGLLPFTEKLVRK
ncbi:30S ribosomal protein S18 [Thermus aquaticus]|uniref:Small ribosomal subunit protein bS18 n=2 Tax=Thermus aquaticus TaxID=271 RepID=A0A0N0BLJ2_THEAQ|nr:30S ribosomal protein S18 [Thermus aquaticus]ALJ89992.1 SSU ribosomal protein S18p, zinc-independent [Thermus aquaticus Y51MC23]KOX89644.1 30S ribosomal protein S18 [Thermus aquaticus]